MRPSCLCFNLYFLGSHWRAFLRESPEFPRRFLLTLQDKPPGMDLKILRVLYSRRFPKKGLFFGSPQSETDNGVSGYGRPTFQHNGLGHRRRSLCSGLLSTHLISFAQSSPGGTYLQVHAPDNPEAPANHGAPPEPDTRARVAFSWCA